MATVGVKLAAKVISAHRFKETAHCQIISMLSTSRVGIAMEIGCMVPRGPLLGSSSETEQRRHSYFGDVVGMTARAACIPASLTATNECHETERKSRLRLAQLRSTSCYPHSERRSWYQQAKGYMDFRSPLVTDNLTLCSTN